MLYLIVYVLLCWSLSGGVAMETALAMHETPKQTLLWFLTLVFFSPLWIPPAAIVVAYLLSQRKIRDWYGKKAQDTVR